MVIIKKEVLIIGGGPIGIACALYCKKNSLAYCVVEKGALTNSIFNYPLNMQFFSTSEKLELDDIPFISTTAKPGRNEALEYYRRIVTTNQLDISLFERILSVQKEGATFKVISSKNTYSASNVIVATGFYDIPKLLHVPGETLPKVSHYYKEAHPYVLQKNIVVGASNSAVDAALEIWRKGGDVTMVVRGKSIGERVKYWVKPDIENRISEGSIRAFFNAEISEIREKEVVINTLSGTKILENDYVIALTGYVPNFKFLEDMGVMLSEDKKIPHFNENTMESNVQGLYLAGVICGGVETHKWFIENSRVHAQRIVDTIVKKRDEVNTQQIEN